MGASTSWNPQGLSRLVMGLPYLYPRRVRSLALEGKKAFAVLHCTNMRVGRTVALRETQEDH